MAVYVIGFVVVPVPGGAARSVAEGGGGRGGGIGGLLEVKVSAQVGLMLLLLRRGVAADGASVGVLDGEEGVAGVTVAGAFHGGGSWGGGEDGRREAVEELGGVVGGLGEAHAHADATADATWAAAAGEDDEDEAAEEEQGLEDGHAFLEDDLVGEDAEAGAQGDDLALRLLALRLEGDDGRLPDLVVLRAYLAQLAEHRLVKCIEEQVHLGYLPPLEPG